MSTLRSLASRLSAISGRRELDERVDEEHQFHIRMQNGGKRSARDGSVSRPDSGPRKIGNTTQLCEEVHRMNTIEFLEETGVRP